MENPAQFCVENNKRAQPGAKDAPKEEDRE